tara:strand:- start:1894 stop:2823 length:930 start_codon:yes stop_codon:yes gene_type:complete
MLAVDPEKYKEFAEQTYETVSDSMRAAVLRSAQSDLPVLIMVGEHHLDIKQEREANKHTPDNMQNPASAAAFTEIATLEAAARLVGRDHMAFSMELPSDTLARLVSEIKDHNGTVPQNRQHLPFMHTIAYAVNNNIAINPSDPGIDYRKTDPEQREQMQRDSVAALACDDDIRLVVHVGGVNHISNFSGYTNEEVQNAQGHLTRSEARDPFNGIYSETVFFNASHYSRDFLNDMKIPKNAASYSETVYSTNPRNAVQINAPGSIDRDTRAQIGEMVREAAQKHASGQSIGLLDGGQASTPDADAPIYKV